MYTYLSKNIFGILAALIVSNLFIACNPTDSSEENPLYKDPKANVEDRVKDLLSRMTLEEKVAQTYCYAPDRLWDKETDYLSDALIDSLLKDGIGELRDFSWVSIDTSVAIVNKLQKKLVEDTRLGIPTIFHSEGLHGYVNDDATSFPQPIAMAGSWDRDLIHRIYSVTAAEARSRGVQHILTPVLDIARDPRWGRTTETFGEDPFLTAELITQAILAFQGEGDTYLDKSHVMSTLKHFPSHGNPEGGLNASEAQVHERLLRNNHMFPFMKAIQDANASSIMAMYGTINGEAIHGSKYYLDEVLRKEIGFDGLIVSDYAAIQLMTPGPLWDIVGHNVAEDSIEAAYLAVKAGVNIELVDPFAYPSIEGLVKEGRLSEAELDELITPLLKFKFELGLFENPYVDAKVADELAHRESSNALALEAAEKSIVMLKNDGDLLPLDNTKIKTLAVVGPNANRELLGDYSTSKPRYFTTILDGIKEQAGEGVNIIYDEGCKITAMTPENKEQIERDRQSIKAATKKVKNADAIVVVVGGDHTTAKEGMDRNQLSLAGVQEELILEMTKLGKPVILCIIGGLPYAIPEAYEAVDAVYLGWYLGQEGGNAIANTLFGMSNPSSKLSISIPKSVGHLPVFYNKMPISYQRKYTTDSKGGGYIYPFGYGLSYSKFKYANLKVTQDTIAMDSEIKVMVDVENVSNVAGTEVVQLYIQDKVSSTTRPTKELKDFTRVELVPREKKTVEFTFKTDRLSFYNIENKFTVEPGDFDIMVGASSEDDDLLKTSIHVKK